jgi:6-bladed beta-propeller
MNLKRYDHGAALAFPLAILASLWCLEAAALNPPLMAVDPNWPKPLPNGWVTGQVGGTCIDSQDHVFIVTRGFQSGGLTSPEGVGGANPNTGALGGAFKSRASPPVIEFDPAGNMVNAWGNPALVPAGQPFAGQNAVLPNGMHGCYVDYQDNVWIGGNSDGVVQKYTHDGSVMLLQIGTKFVCDRPDLPGGTGACANGTPPQTGNSQTLLNLPAAIAVDPNPDPMPPFSPGSIYIADGYGNHRVVVFDATGKYLRQFGSVGTGPDQFTAGDGGHPHCVRLGKDQLIYACDRGQNKINVYQRDGTFVGNIGVIPGQVGTGQEGSGTAWDIDFSKDPAQTWAFISDGQNEILWTFNHATALTGGTPVAGFGGFGHDPGLFSFLHMMAIDSKGAIYVGETIGGNRIQKILTKTLPTFGPK